MMTLILHSDSGSEKWLNSEYVLKVKPTGFTYYLNEEKGQGV